MAYQVKRNEAAVEELHLLDSEGNVIHKISVRLDPDGMAKKVSERYTELLHIHTRLQNLPDGNKEAAFSELGSAVVGLFTAVFGEEEAQKIISFYDGNYIEMCRNVTPFITRVIIPALRKTMCDNRKIAASSYNRKIRRRFGRRK